MSMNPVDPASAGFRHAGKGADAEQASGERALAQVVAEVLCSRGEGPALPGGADQAAWGAVRYLRPALELLSDLHGGGRLAWDGLVHRRLRLVPPPPGQAGTTAQPQLVTTWCGGWGLTQATATAGGWRATAWLARRDDPRCLPQEPPPARTAPSEARSSRPELVVRDEDVKAWARASGDDNRIHLEPGAGRRIGLTARDGLVAHGMLLVALSLALVPAREGLDVRLVAPVVVDGATGLWSHGGDLYGADGLVLRRRS